MFKLHTLLSAIHVQLHVPDLLPETCLVVLPEVQRHSLRLLYKKIYAQIQRRRASILADTLTSESPARACH